MTPEDEWDLDMRLKILKRCIKDLEKLGVPYREAWKVIIRISVDGELEPGATDEDE